jgi:hypothetical protein
MVERQHVEPGKPSPRSVLPQSTWHRRRGLTSPAPSRQCGYKRRPNLAPVLAARGSCLTVVSPSHCSLRYASNLEQYGFTWPSGANLRTITLCPHIG